MKVVIQRVSRAEVRAGEARAAIGRGLLVLAGLEKGDGEATVAWMAAKIAGLRLFEDEAGRMNLDLAQAGGALLAVSQFTLAGSVQKGRRPGFDGAMAPEAARALFGTFVERLRETGLPVETGFFREHMEVELVNDGPVTFTLEHGEGRG